MITTAVNLQAPLYAALAEADGLGVGGSTLAFAAYVAGVLPVLLAFSGVANRLGRRTLILMALGLAWLATTLTLLFPGLFALGVARGLMGIGTALTSSVAPAYMFELYRGRDTRVPAVWVTASTSLGFGLGAAVTSLFVLQSPSITPPSLWLYLVAGGMAIFLVATLPDTAPRQPTATMLRLPAYPPGAFSFGLAILLAWATVGVVIAILPSVLATHGLAAWSGFATFGICSCGIMFQPWARRLSSRASVQLGLAILPLAYGLIVWGALQGNLMTVLLGTLAASSACYGFVYLGGLSGVMALAGPENNARASAGFFLMAYLGFSLPVITTGLLIDAYGQDIALTLFGIALAIGSVGVVGSFRYCRREKRQGG